MGQYNDKVERQRLLLEAEKWARGVKTIHSHQLSSMWYDDRPEDTKDSPVTDRMFNDGTVERFKKGKLIHVFGTALSGEKLVDEYRRHN